MNVVPFVCQFLFVSLRVASWITPRRPCNARRDGPNIKQTKSNRGEGKRVADAHEPSRAGETTGQGVGGDGADNSLEDAARDEREYARVRLRAELGREPTEEEVSEWLRQQTEGY